MIGIMRPLIGGVFGFVLLLLLNSGISIFSLTAGNATAALANLIILGFMAGFFERFVPDILDVTKEKILDSNGDSLQTNNSPQSNP